MLALKVTYKEELGEDFGPKKEVKKPKGDANQAPSAKNAEKAAKKAAAKAEKEAKKAANRKAREEAEKEKAKKLAGVGQENYGKMEPIKSQVITKKIWTNIKVRICICACVGWTLCILPFSSPPPPTPPPHSP